MRVGPQALLDVLVGDVEHVLLQHRWIVGLCPNLVVDVAALKSLERLALLPLFLLLLDVRHNLVRDVVAESGNSSGGRGREMDVRPARVGGGRGEMRGGEE